VFEADTDEAVPVRDSHLEHRCGVEHVIGREDVVQKVCGKRIDFLVGP